MQGIMVLSQLFSWAELKPHYYNKWGIKFLVNPHNTRVFFRILYTHSNYESRQCSHRPYATGPYRHV